jgi:hypothetical protein
VPSRLGSSRSKELTGSQVGPRGLQRRCRECFRPRLHKEIDVEAAADGIMKDPVVVGGKRSRAARIKALIACMGVDEPRAIKAVAADHAADRVRDQFLAGVGAKAGLHVVAKAVLDRPLVVGEARAVAVGGVDGKRDLIDRHVGREFVREAACRRGRQSKIKRALVDQNQRVPQLVDGSVSAG